MAEENDLKNMIRTHAVSLLPPRRVQETNLYLEETPYKAGAVIRAYKQEIAVKRPTLLVFVDEQPRQNWAHDCKYLLYDASTGELYDQVRARFPPNLVQTSKTYKAFHQPVSLAVPTVQWSVKPWLRCPVILPKGQRYAILFAGAANNRHTNDLEFLYRTLRDHYGFQDKNIYVLNYDGTVGYNNYGSPPGTTWPGDGTAYRMPVWGKGTKADFEKAFDDLKTKLKPEDLLLIHTNNHGGNDGHGKSYLCVYSGDSYYAKDFADKLAELPKFADLMVMMEQCHSGGFNAPIIAKSPAARTTVASACTEANNSAGGADWDPFAKDWISAMAGHTPSGGALNSNPDTEGNGSVDAEEAYAYADANKVASDTPVYDETSEAAGDATLGQRYSVYWWYCIILKQYLKPVYLHWPIPEFYAILHHQVLPELKDIQQTLERGGDLDRKATALRVKAVIEKAYAKKPKAR